MKNFQHNINPSTEAQICETAMLAVKCMHFMSMPRGILGGETFRATLFQVN